MTGPADTSIAIVIPSFERGPILLKTIELLLAQTHRAVDIVVVDQTDYKDTAPELLALKKLHKADEIILIRPTQPSIPAAMNRGLLATQADYILFLDDDISVKPDFIAQHLSGLRAAVDAAGILPVCQVGQVLQPAQEPVQRPASYRSGFGLNRDLHFPFHSDFPASLNNCMAGNLCVNRSKALQVGGFDENFSGAAYRFETEFARRLVRASNQQIKFWPAATIDHLQWHQGGTRQHGSHLSSTKGIHSMGAYYYALKEGHGWNKLEFILKRFGSSIFAKFYLRQPWYIPARLLGELRGLAQAIGTRRTVNTRVRYQAANQTKLPSRVMVLMSHPTQHFVPVYRHLENQPDVQLKVLFLAENGTRMVHDPGFGQELKWDKSMTDGYSHEFLQAGKELVDFSLLEMDFPMISAAVNDYKPDLIWLHGYGQLANWRVCLSRPNNARIVYSSDSNLSDPRSRWRTAIKYLAVKFFLSRCQSFLAVSPNNRAYLQSFGVPSEKLISVPFPVDIRAFSEARAALPDKARGQLRSKLGLSHTAKVFLFAGKLQQHKRAIDLVEALGRISNNDVCAILVGSGAEYHSTQARITELSLGHRVKMVGFVNQSELPAYFNASDALVFPSEREPYGTVAAEVLPFGLPIIASDVIGAVGSAILSERNAILYPATNCDALAQAIRRLTKDSALALAMGHESFLLADQHDAAHFANAIAEVAGLC